MLSTTLLRNGAVLLFLIHVSLIQSVSCQYEEEERTGKSFIGELDKAADTMSNIKCQGQKDWLLSSSSGNQLQQVSCHSMYELCKRTVDSLYPAKTFELLDNNNDTTNNSTAITSSEAYGYGFVMVLLVSLLSLLGIAIVPLLTNSNRFGRITYRYMLTLLTAMGVSALLCGSLFELLPTVLNVNDNHDHDHVHVQDGHGHSQEQIWKASGVVGGVFLFYLLELVLHSFIDTAKHSKPSPTAIKKKIPNGERDDKDPLMSDTNIRIHSRPRDYEGTCCQRYFSLKHVRPLAWIILIGDFVHNFADGITVGAAISQSLSLGLSTTFAICLHEIPHELADFGILVKCGMHWICALLFNFLSSLSAIAGFFIGVAISTNSTVLKEWILAIAAGSFLYISLADLLPELWLSSHTHDHDVSHTHSDDVSHEQEKQHTWGHKIIHAIIVLLGFSISFVTLLLVSLNEDKLNNLF